MERKPKVSVCMPTYNKADFIAEAIQSVLDQTFKDFELIITDDVSSDNSEEIIRSFNDPRIKFIKNKKNLGMINNWNKAVSMANGEYITILHGDDRYLPEFLAAESEILDKSPNVGYVFSACNIIDENGNPKWVHRWQEKKHYGLFILARCKESLIIDGHKLLKEHLFDNFVRFPTVMVRKECYKKVGMYSDAFRHPADWDMWMRIELYPFKIAYSAQVLAEYRKHAGSFTASNSKRGKNVIEDYKMIAKTVKAASEKNILSKRQKNATLNNIIGILLRDQFQSTWNELKNRNVREAKEEFLTLMKWKKEFNLRYPLLNILIALTELRI